MPQYLKTNGVNQIVIDSWAKKKLSEGYLQIPTIKILIKVGLEVGKLNIKQIRLVPKNGYIVIEFIHEVTDIQPKVDNKRYMSIDLGINNLCSCSSNVINSFIVFLIVQISIDKILSGKCLFILFVYKQL